MKNSNVIKLSPSFKELIWGGTKLRSYFGFDTPGANTAEALVLSCRDNAECVDSKGMMHTGTDIVFRIAVCRSK